MKRFFVAAVVSACATVELPESSEVSGTGGFTQINLLSGSPGGKAYCVGHCFDEDYAHPYNGWFCFCDASCLNLGDCCPDMFSACGCRGYCDLEHPTGCHCDDSCENLGDCCPLKVNYCR